MYFDDEKDTNTSGVSNEEETNSSVLEENTESEESNTDVSLDTKEVKKSKKGHSHVDIEAKEEEQHSRILEYLKNEHKWENYVLLILSIMALMLGCLIINGTLEVSDSFPIIGNFPKVFAWILIGLSALAILLSVWPFFKPAFPELKKVTWPKARTFGADVARVFIFLIILVAVLLLFDAFVAKLIKFIIGLND